MGIGKSRLGYIVGVVMPQVIHPARLFIQVALNPRVEATYIVLTARGGAGTGSIFSHEDMLKTNTEVFRSREFIGERLEPDASDQVPECIVTYLRTEVFPDMLDGQLHWFSG
jgi:hypothetical protein